MVDCHEIFPEQNCVGNFLYHDYFSCDRREHNRVGKLFDAITLRVYKKITNRNTGKPPQHCAAFKHYCLRLLPDLFGRMTVGPFSFSSFFFLNNGTAKTVNIFP